MGTSAVFLQCWPLLKTSTLNGEFWMWSPPNLKAAMCEKHCSAKLMLKMCYIVVYCGKLQCQLSAGNLINIKLIQCKILCWDYDYPEEIPSNQSESRQKMPSFRNTLFLLDIYVWPSWFGSVLAHCFHFHCPFLSFGAKCLSFKVRMWPEFKSMKPLRELYQTPISWKKLTADYNQGEVGNALSLVQKGVGVFVRQGEPL